jgi:hypothetical protein
MRIKNHNINGIKIVKILTKLILIFVFCLGNIVTKINAQGTGVIRQLITFKNDSIEYIVLENSMTIIDEIQAQTNYSYELHQNSDGFKIYGITLADLYALSYNVNKNCVKSELKEKNLYNVIYKGLPNDSIKKEIFEQIVKLKKLFITESTCRELFYIMDIKKSKKLKRYLSISSSIGSFVNGTNEKYVFTNTPFPDFVEKLNSKYQDHFLYEGDQKTRYNLEFPNEKNEKYIVKYLKKRYGIKIRKIHVTLKIYTIKGLST